MKKPQLSRLIGALVFSGLVLSIVVPTFAQDVDPANAKIQTQENLSARWLVSPVGDSTEWRLATVDEQDHENKKSDEPSKYWAINPPKPSTADLWLSYAVDPQVKRVQDLVGVKFRQIQDQVVRAQLKIPVGQGLVIDSVAGKSAGAEAGLTVGDIVVSVLDTPVRSSNEFYRLVLDAKQPEHSIRLLRAGVYKTTDLLFDPQDVSDKEYIIGVNVQPASVVLRKQLRLSTDVGLVVTSAINELPAQKGGMLEYDVIVKANNEPIGSAEALHAVVANSANSHIRFQVLRDGNEMKINVKPVERDNDSNDSITLAKAQDLVVAFDRNPTGVDTLASWKDTDLTLSWGDAESLVWRTAQAIANENPLQKRVDELSVQVEKLTTILEQLKQELKK